MSTSSRGKIARWTTPSIRYKPSQVEMADITEVYMTIRQKEAVIIQKDISGASVGEDGFTWLLSQEETGLLDLAALATVQVDYKTASGLRYTTSPKTFDIAGSAIDEVI